MPAKNVEYLQVDWKAVEEHVITAGMVGPNALALLLQLKQDFQESLLGLGDDSKLKHQFQVLTDQIQAKIYASVNFEDKNLSPEMAELKAVNDILLTKLWGEEHPNTRSSDSISRDYFFTRLMSALYFEEINTYVLPKMESHSTEIDPNLMDRNGNNIVLLALKAYKISILEELLHWFPNVDVNHLDHSGATALHYAYLFGQYEMANRLVKAGAQFVELPTGEMPSDLLQEDYESSIEPTLSSVGVHQDRDLRALYNNIPNTDTLLTRTNVITELSKAKTESEKHLCEALLPPLAGASIKETILAQRQENLQKLKKLELQPEARPHLFTHPDGHLSNSPKL